MSFLPAGFDPRADVSGMLNLVELDTPDGPARFWVGADGRFTDINGNIWYGSQLISDGGADFPRGTAAPAGQLTFSYFQDPDADDLISKVRELGDDYMRDRDVKFYLMPLNSHDEFYKPKHAPVLVDTRVGSHISYSIQGDTIRAISLHFETAWVIRKQRRAFYYTTADHEALIGETNPSMDYVPLDVNDLLPLYV